MNRTARNAAIVVLVLNLVLFALLITRLELEPDSRSLGSGPGACMDVPGSAGDC